MNFILGNAQRMHFVSVLGRVGCFPVPGCTDVRGTVAVILQGLHEEKLTKDK